MNINPRWLMGLAAAALTYLLLTAFVGFVDSRSNGFHCERANWHNQYNEARQPESFQND